MMAFTRGRALTQREAKALKVGDRVWMTYTKGSHPGYRVDEAVKVIGRNEKGLDFTPGGFFFDCFLPDDDLIAFSDGCGTGESYLYTIEEAA